MALKLIKLLPLQTTRILVSMVTIINQLSIAALKFASFLKAGESYSTCPRFGMFVLYSNLNCQIILPADIQVACNYRESSPEQALSWIHVFCKYCISLSSFRHHYNYWQLVDIIHLKDPDLTPKSVLENYKGPDSRLGRFSLQLWLDNFLTCYWFFNVIQFQDDPVCPIQEWGCCLRCYFHGCSEKEGQ